MLPIFFSYLLKLNVALGMVYLFYRLVLQSLTFYNWNRFYLLSFIALSFLIPLVDISALWEGAREAPVPAITKYIYPVEALQFTGRINAEETKKVFRVWDWLMLVILGGSGVLLMRTALQFLSFIRLKRRAQLISDQGIKIYRIDAEILPFSFGRSIFLNSAVYPESNLQEIIRHELVHVQQGHTADIILVELVCILNWFNPFAWLLRQQLRQNLEFIADEQVLQSGIDKKHYQYLLLQVNGLPAFRLANQFNFSPLKNRIVMMNKMPSARPQLAKFLFLLPLVAVLLFAFRSVKTIAEGKDNQSLTLIDGINLNNYGQDKPTKQNEPKNLISWKAEENNIGVAYFQDGTQERYDLATEAGKQKMRAAQLFMGDAYKPEDLTRRWSKDFKIFLDHNPQVTKIKWRYDIDQIEKGNVAYLADRLYLTLKSGAEEVYEIENSADLARVENKFGKLPLLPPPPPEIAIP